MRGASARIKTKGLLLLPFPLCIQGLDSGYAGGEDESYNVYDQAWRKDKDMANNIYRPSKNAEKDYGEDFDKIVKSNRSVRSACPTVMLHLKLYY